MRCFVLCALICAILPFLSVCMPALVAPLKNRVIVMGYPPGFQVCAAYGIEKLNQAVLTVSLIIKSLGLFLAPLNLVHMVVNLFNGSYTGGSVHSSRLLS